MTSRAPRAAVVASDPEVEAVARELLGRGRAVDAVAAGVFAACARAPSVLMGPVQVLLGGGGAGLHAVDGRVQQPGKGLARPRGFRAGEDIPEAARVGSPALVAALSTAIASFGAVSLARVIAPAVDLARKRAPRRSALLARIAERGPLALSEARVAEELTAAAGRGQGGLLSDRDLEELRPKVVRAERTELGGGLVVRAP